MGANPNIGLQVFSTCFGQTCVKHGVEDFLEFLQFSLSASRTNIMEKVLKKLADELNNLDEASLISLWDKYYERVQSFTPSRQWEEDILILSMIQAVRWKNQLFNQCMSEHPQEKSQDKKSLLRPVRRNKIKKTAKVLSFRPRE